MKSGVRPGRVPCFAILVLPPSSISGTLSELQVLPLKMYVTSYLPLGMWGGEDDIMMSCACLNAQPLARAP